MSKYEFPVSEELLPNGRSIVTINSTDGSGDDEDNKFHVYGEDVPKLIRQLLEFQGIDVAHDEHLKELLG